MAVTGTGAAELPGDGEPPVPELFAAVVGQPAAVAAFRAAARRPVHAYLVVGPAGTGALPLVRGFAAGLLCPEGGCGRCATCRRVSSGAHPDLVEVERAGPALRATEVRDVVVAAHRRPLEAARQVIVVPDVHLALPVVAALLKTVEEPPPATIVVLTAETVPPELATLASRCARVALRPVPDEAVAGWLVAGGVAPDVAAEAARAARGSPDRARVLAEDPALVERQARWRSVPERLDGTGAAAAALAADLVQSIDGAVAVLAERHREEEAALAAQAEAMGERAGAARKALEERHKREQRRWRMEEWRMGFGVLAATYRDRIVAAGGGAGTRLAVRQAAQALGRVEQAAADLVRNPNERLLAEALLVRLGRLS
jgi:DNA polymerase-3 subunit delta'